MNYGCQSAAELLVLNLRQSKKVTLFGENTRGAVDYLDYYPIRTKSGNYILTMPTSRRYIEKNGRKLDNIGIAPDIYISDTTDDWVKEVQRYYER